MKKLRNFLGYASCLVIALMAFSSCLSNDNDYDITVSDAEAKMIFDAAKGTYEGDLYAVYEQQGFLFRTKDSVPNVTITIGLDTIVRLNSIPDSLYSRMLSHNHTLSNKAKEDLAKHLTTQPAESKIGALGFTNKQKNIYRYLTNGFKATLTANYDSKPHEVVFSNNMLCFYNPANKKLQIAVQPALINADKERLAPSGLYLMFVSKTKH